MPAAGAAGACAAAQIALTEPFLKRFERRSLPAVAWHSDLRSSQRRRAWRGIASGEAVTVGARSALFLPYPARPDRRRRERMNHRSSRKTASSITPATPRVMRAKFEDIPVVLSRRCRPSKADIWSRTGRYREVSLTETRFAFGASLPDIGAIDLTRDPPPRGRWLRRNSSRRSSQPGARRAVAAICNRRGLRR